MTYFTQSDRKQSESKVEQKSWCKNILSQYLRVHKMSLVVVKTSLAEVTVGQSVLQEVSSVELVPRVFNLTRNEC